MSEIYITIEQYAENQGITIDEAREILKSNAYKKYYKVVNNTELVNSAITKNEAKETKQEANNSSEDIEKLNKVIEELRKELGDKNKIIAEKDRQINDYALRFAELAIQAQQIASQAQVLQLSDKTELYKELPPAEQDKKKNLFRRLFRGKKNENN